MICAGSFSLARQPYRDTPYFQPKTTRKSSHGQHHSCGPDAPSRQSGYRQHRLHGHRRRGTAHGDRRQCTDRPGLRQRCRCPGGLSHRLAGDADLLGRFRGDDASRQGGRRLLLLCDSRAGSAPGPGHRLHGVGRLHRHPGRRLRLHGLGGRRLRPPQRRPRPPLVDLLAAHRRHRRLSRLSPYRTQRQGAGGGAGAGDRRGGDHEPDHLRRRRRPRHRVLLLHAECRAHQWSWRGGAIRAHRFHRLRGHGGVS